MERDKPKPKKKVKKIKNILQKACTQLQTFVHLHKETHKLNKKQNENFKQQNERKHKSKPYRIRNHGCGYYSRRILRYGVGQNRILIMKKAAKVIGTILYFIIAFTPIFILGYMLGLKLI